MKPIIVQPKTYRNHNRPHSENTNFLRYFIFIIFIQTLKANPALRDQSELDIIVSTNEERIGLNFPTIRSVHSANDDLDSNGDDVRLHKRHHHHHEGRHHTEEGRNETTLPVKVSTATEYGRFIHRLV